MVRKFRITVQGQTYDVDVEELGSSQAPSVSRPAPAAPQSAPTVSKATPTSPTGSGVITAPLPGEILKLLVKVGDSVKSGDALLILEAMKMESEITADRDGTVKKVLVEKGTIVESGQDLVVIG